MNTITSEEFENYYGINLLPYSTSNTQIGELMHKKGIFSKTLEYDNESILDAISLDSSKRTNLNNSLKSIELSDAQFPNIKINNNFSNNETIKVPIIGLDLSSIFSNKHQFNFTLTNVKAKTLQGELEFNIRELLEHSEKASQTIKNKYLITQLFYAEKIDLNTTHDIEEDLQASVNGLKNKNINLSSKTNSDGSNTYTFSGVDNSPFAAHLIKVKNWVTFEKTASIF